MRRRMDDVFAAALPWLVAESRRAASSGMPTRTKWKARSAYRSRSRPPSILRTAWASAALGSRLYDELFRQTESEGHPRSYRRALRCRTMRASRCMKSSACGRSHTSRRSDSSSATSGRCRLLGANPVRRRKLKRDRRSGGSTSGITAFIIPNPWDIGSARILEHIGFEALATTSMGYAFSLGKLDTTVDRDDDAGAHRARSRTRRRYRSMPISRTATATIRAPSPKRFAWPPTPASSADRSRMRPAAPAIRSTTSIVAVERVRAAVAAARALPFPFTLTARAENYLHGRPDLDDTIRRLKAFEECRRRCAVCAWPSQQGRHRRGRDVGAAAGERVDGTAGRPARARPNCRRSARAASASAARCIARRWARSFAPPTRCATRARSSSPPTPPIPGTSRRIFGS